MSRSLSIGETLFIGDWVSLGVVHFRIAPDELQPSIPFELDLFKGRAYVSLVFFTMRGMRLARSPRMLDWLFHPFREQRFLNVRTYVRHDGEPGIHFIAEWISNPVCVWLGPPLYSLPYRWGTHKFSLVAGTFRARLDDRATRSSLQCDFKRKGPLCNCAHGSRDEFLFERYTAFNGTGRKAKSFRVSHEPWEQQPAEPNITDDSLLRTYFSWFGTARIAGANYSPGVCNVRLSRPFKVRASCAHLRPAHSAA